MTTASRCAREDMRVRGACLCESLTAAAPPDGALPHAVPPPDADAVPCALPCARAAACAFERPDVTSLDAMLRLKGDVTDEW